jgi:hypothetical protein
MGRDRIHACRVSDVYIAACIGARGDACGFGAEITAAETEEHHALADPGPLSPQLTRTGNHLASNAASIDCYQYRLCNFI